MELAGRDNVPDTDKLFDEIVELSVIPPVYNGPLKVVFVATDVATPVLSKYCPPDEPNKDWL